MKDVAQRAGVALGTVSRILNGHDNVAPVLRSRVHQAIAELGYQRNAAARSMRLGRTQVVGCIVSDIRQPIAAMMVTAAETELRAAGYAMIVASTHYDDEREREIMAFMRERSVDGIIMIINRDNDAETVNRLRDLQVPIVLWERDAGDQFDSVLSEHRAGVTSAVTWLIEEGHSDIALIGAHPDTWVGREQAGGYSDAFSAAGLVPSRDVLAVDKVDQDVMRRLLDTPDHPTAVVANINAIPSVLAVAAQAQLAIPGDLSVVSIGDSEMLSLIAPAVSALVGDPDYVGRTATRLLLARLSNLPASSPQSVAVPMQLIHRSST